MNQKSEIRNLKSEVGSQKPETKNQNAEKKKRNSPGLLAAMYIACLPSRLRGGIKGGACVGTTVGRKMPPPSPPRKREGKPINNTYTWNVATFFWFLVSGFWLLAITIPLVACTTTAERLSRLGKVPELAEVRNPQEDPAYKPLQSWPLPKEQGSPPQSPNSLWQKGSKAFFKDQRASRVGDILKVRITIDDKAELDNQTNSSRTTSESLGVPNALGFEKNLEKVLNKPTLDSLLKIDGKNNNDGKGTIGRKEKIETELAATVIQVLPNGNLSIQGKQEIRVNAEVREVYIAGVIRPEDIASDNTISSSQVAEARISYGGRGSLSDVQQPRIGSQVLDIIAPF